MDTMHSRRHFLRLCAAAAAAPMLPATSAWAQGIDPSRVNRPDTFSVPRAEVEALIRPLFVAGDEAMMQLAVDAYHQCVLGKVRAAESPLEHRWLVPGGVYVGQWLWDTMFVCDLLAILPNQRELIREVFQNYWDFQRRWNAEKPKFMHGMIPNFIAPASAGGEKWREFPVYSQAPLLAWGMERVVLRNGDLELVRQGIQSLEDFHEWYWRERDLRGLGLVCVGSYDGVAQNARYETYDNEVDLDGMQMTVHPTRRGPGEGAWYGNLCIPCNTAYLLLSEQSLARLAERVGDHSMATRRRARYEKGRRAMQRHMWDERAGCFLAVDRETLAKATSMTVGGLTPLMAAVPTRHQAERMARAIEGKEWMTPLPLPSVSSLDPAYRSDGFWRGDVWPAPVYQTATGLAACGERKLAARIADAVIANALKVGISEHYDSQTGAPLGVRGLGMSALVLTMALDGLSDRFHIRVRR